MASCSSLSCRWLKTNASKPSDKAELKDGNKLYGERNFLGYGPTNWCWGSKAVVKHAYAAASVVKVTRAKAEYQKSSYTLFQNWIGFRLKWHVQCRWVCWADLHGAMQVWVALCTWQASYGLASRLGAGLGIGSELYLPLTVMLEYCQRRAVMLPCTGHLLPGTSLAQWLDTALWDMESKAVSTYQALMPKEDLCRPSPFRNLHILPQPGLQGD